MTEEFKPGWLNKIALPTKLSKRAIVRKQHCRLVNPQLAGVWNIVSLIEAGKLASAAHAWKKWKSKSARY
jgi:hypothetical protein